jgi:hypothetical protein
MKRSSLTFGAKLLEAAALHELSNLFAETLGGRWTMHWSWPQPPDARRHLVVEWTRSGWTARQYFTDTEIVATILDPRLLIIRKMYAAMMDVDAEYRAQEEARRYAIEPHPMNLDRMRREDVDHASGL